MTMIQFCTYDAKFRPEVIGGRACNVKVSELCSGAGNDGPREFKDCARLADIRAAVAEYGARMALAMPGVSFEVGVRVARGERKPRGFDAAYQTGDKLGVEAWIQTDPNA